MQAEKRSSELIVYYLHGNSYPVTAVMQPTVICRFCVVEIGDGIYIGQANSGRYAGSSMDSYFLTAKTCTLSWCTQSGKAGDLLRVAVEQVDDQPSRLPLIIRQVRTFEETAIER